MNRETLEKYADAWNRHDIDTIMSMMTDDCVFMSGGGRETSGSRYEGQEQVRLRFEQVWAEIPDVRFDDARHFVSGDRGLSQWTLSGTRTNGESLEVNGCDIFTFRGGKIWIKDSYLKTRK